MVDNLGKENDALLEDSADSSDSSSEDDEASSTESEESDVIMQDSTNLVESAATVSQKKNGSIGKSQVTSNCSLIKKKKLYI